MKLLDISGEEQEYEVYFKVSREKNGALRLYVESAYIRGTGYDSAQPRKRKINFFVIAFNTQTGRPIKVPK